MAHSKYMPLRIIWLIALSALGLGLFAMLGASAQPVTNTSLVARAADANAVQKTAAQTVDYALGQRLNHLVTGNKPARQR